MISLTYSFICVWKSRISIKIVYHDLFKVRKPPPLKRLCFLLEQTPSNCQSGHYNGNHTHQFNPKCSNWDWMYLRRVTYRVTGNRCFVELHFLYRQVPSSYFLALSLHASCIGHENGKRETEDKYKSNRPMTPGTQKH